MQVRRESLQRRCRHQHIQHQHLQHHRLHQRAHNLTRWVLPSRVHTTTMSQPPGRIRAFFTANFTTSFIYPLKGIWYFATHRYLHPLIRNRIIPLTLLSALVLVLLFMTIYLPLVAVMAIFHLSKGSAWANATSLVLGIGTLIVTVLFEALLVDKTQVDIFDAVMVAEGYETLVRTRRPVTEDIDEADPVRRLGVRERGATFAPFSFRQILEFILLLPLNFVPFVGIPLFLLATGYRAGPLVNWRYFAVKGFTKKERNDFVKSKQRRFEYMWYGVFYMILQLVPVLSMMFLLTSAAGSALWSVHLEQEQLHNGAVQEQDDLTADYTDDP